jgi:hypothetical protein
LNPGGTNMAFEKEVRRTGEIIDTRKLVRSEIMNILPRRLYKYFPINDNTFNVLRKNSLWFSSPNKFNDPFDCKLKINFGKTKEETRSNLLRFFSGIFINEEVKEKLINFSSKTKRFNVLFNQMTHFVFDESVGVCCFSQYCDSPLMWAHYAESHRGICLMFNNRKMNFIKRNLIPVQYYSDYPVFDLSEYRDNQFQEFLLNLLSSKFNDWAYEFEWRAIKEKGADRLFRFEKDFLEGIIFGINISDENKNKIKQIMRRKKASDIKYFQAIMSDSDYKIKIMKEKG